MNLGNGGIIIILAGILLVIAGSLLTAKNFRFGGLILIGPIPISFGSSPDMTITAMVLGLVILIISIILWRRND